MIKFILFFIIDALWYYCYIEYGYTLLLKNIKSLHLSGDSTLLGVVEVIYFSVINIIFLIIQLIIFYKLTIKEYNKKKILRIKKIMFIFHNIFLFGFELFAQIMRNKNGDEYALSWFFKFLWFIIISYILYHILITQLGKRLKWVVKENT